MSSAGQENDPDAWLQLTLDVPVAAVECCSEILQQAGAISVSLADAADELLLEPVPGAAPLWKMVRISGLFKSMVDKTTITTQLQEKLPDSRIHVKAERVADRDWSNTWREDFSAMRFGQKLWVCPGDEQAEDPDAVVIRLDPGLAFGTGTHATTAMCLEWLDAHPPTGRYVIDYGCGSGILAIAASLLGAQSVHAVDIDPQALVATRDNAQRNDIDHGLLVSPPVSLQEQQADVLLANILAGPLIELADELFARLRRDGELVMTGILADQAGQVMAAYRPAIEFADPVQRGDWVLLYGRKR